MIDGFWLLTAKSAYCRVLHALFWLLTTKSAYRLSTSSSVHHASRDASFCSALHELNEILKLQKTTESFMPKEKL
jgi:hypothetical protein